MADITNAQVVKFANERTRQIADKVTALSYALRAYQADYAAGGISALITAAGASNLIDDGSAADGRTRITGTSLVNFIAGINALVVQFDATVAGVGTSITAISNGIQVNGSPR